MLISRENIFSLKRNPNGSKGIGKVRKLIMLMVFKQEMDEIRKLLFPGNKNKNKRIEELKKKE